VTCDADQRNTPITSNHWSRPGCGAPPLRLCGPRTTDRYRKPSLVARAFGPCARPLQNNSRAHHSSAEKPPLPTIAVPQLRGLPSKSVPPEDARAARPSGPVALHRFNSETSRDRRAGLRPTRAWLPTSGARRATKTMDPHLLAKMPSNLCFLNVAFSTADAIRPSSFACATALFCNIAAFSDRTFSTPRRCFTKTFRSDRTSLPCFDKIPSDVAIRSKSLCNTTSARACSRANRAA
jgi:hypothetical protein